MRTRLTLPSTVLPSTVLLVAAIGVGAVPASAMAHSPVSAAAEQPPSTPATLQNAVTGTFADLAGGQVAEGRRIVEWKYHGVPGQQWAVTSNGATQRITSAADGRYCLARDSASSAAIVLRGCGNVLAAWEFEQVGEQTWRVREPGGERYLRTSDATPTIDRQLVTGAGSEPAATWYLAGLTVPKRPMPADPRLDQVTFLTAHNAFANSDEGFWGRVPNQSYSLRSQLEQGVRGFQLDVAANGKMCHGNCLWGERQLSAGLRTIVDYLAADHSAVVTVFLEDYTSVETLRAQVGAVPGIQELLFYPTAAGVRSTGWPTVSQLVRDGKRLLIFSQRPGRDSFGVFYDRDWTAENYWSLGLTGSEVSCVSRWTEVPLNRTEPGFVRLHVMNHYRDLATEGGAASDNATLRSRMEQICGPAARRKPNYLAVDFFQKPETGAPTGLVREMNGYW